MDKEEKNTELVRVIRRLSTFSIQEQENEAAVQKEIEILQHIYEDDFRHLYSRIFSTITQNDEDQNNNLLQNIQYINKMVADNGQNEEKFKKSVLKLYDHINLDIARLNYIIWMEKRNSKDKERFAEEISKTATELEDINEKTRALQKEYTAILGIFSAIVITFVAGLVFTSSVLQNIDKASIYRLSCSIWALAFVLVTILGKLFNFIESVTHNRTVKKDNSSCFIKTHKTAIVFILGLIFIFAGWFFDIVGIREKRLNAERGNSTDSPPCEMPSIDAVDN